MKIGIFDSGIGGLSLLHQAMITLPEVDYVFYADVDNVPYGEKTTEQIREYVDRAVDFLVSNGYLLRQPDDIDRRIWRLLITEKSAPIIQEGRAVQQEFGKRLTHGISEEELAAYTQIIQKFKENILAITHNKKGELL